MKATVSSLRECLFCPRSIYLGYVLKLEPARTPEKTKAFIEHKARKELSLREALVLEKAGSVEGLTEALREEVDEIMLDLPFLCRESLADVDVEENISFLRGVLVSETKQLEERLRYLINEAGFEECLRKSRPWRKSYFIDSEELSISGVIDKAMKYETYCPIEIKTRRPEESAWGSDRLEACAYSLLLEADRGIPGGVPYGYVEYSRAYERRPVMNTKKLRARVFEARDKVLEVLGGGIPEICPHGSGGRCESCGFFEACYEI